MSRAGEKAAGPARTPPSVPHLPGFGADPPPRKLRSLYGGALAEAVRAGRIEWRFSGATHVELRDTASGARISLTTGPSADGPGMAGKMRSFLRRVEGTATAAAREGVR